VQERIQRRVCDNPNVAATTTVAAGWPAARHELLAAKRRDAVAAVAPFKPNFYAIDEHDV
jgi:hypothetical protein